MKDLLEFLNENEKCFYNLMSWIKDTLKSMPKTGFIYITSGGNNEKAKKFRSELKNRLKNAGFTNVLTIDEVCLMNPVESDYVYANTLLCSLSKYMEGITIDLNYEQF